MSLKKEALQIVKKLDLLNTLGKLGEARLVGSVPLGLIVKFDIDIHVYVGKKNLVKTASTIMASLFDSRGIHEIRISDYRSRKSLKIGIDNFSGKAGGWSIDIWLTNDKKTTGFEQVNKMLSKLDLDKRQNILRIKRYYDKRGLLKNSLSLKIYEAVIYKNVKSVKGFKKIYG